MKIPLMVTLNNEGQSTVLNIWRNGRKETVEPPVRPYFYSRNDLGEVPESNVSRVYKKGLSDLVEDAWYKYEVPKTSIIYRVRDEYQYLPPTDFGDIQLPFIHRILIDSPDFFKDYPNDEPLRVMHIDIEQYFEKFFPTNDDPIIAVGVGLGSDERVILMCKEKSPQEEARILKELVVLINQYDPDLIVGYNIIGYDLPRLFYRMQAHGLNINVLAREGMVELDEDRAKFGGRIVYDLLHSVLKDQTLHGIKNRKMKTVAKWFKLTDIIDMPNKPFSELIGTDELKFYNESDIKITQQLFEIYFSKIEGMAEYIGSPLDQLIPFSDSYPSTIAQARILADKNIISDGMNKERYPKIFREGEKGFEAATVELFKRGHFSPVVKFDFASLYPHIIWAMGIGPDNTTLLDIVPLGPFACVERGNKKVFSIPDANHKMNFIICVEGESALSLFIQELLKKRLELKRQSKKLKEEGNKTEYEKVESQQYALKVVLNSVFGNNGAAHLRYGSAPVAIMVVGIGRLLIDYLSNHCRDGRIELDTDGIYVDRDYNLDEINGHINFYLSTALLGKPVMKVEKDIFKAGYFHQAKNYILLEEDGDELMLIKHGAAFKGSQLPGIFDQTIDSVAYLLLTRGVAEAKTAAIKALDLSRYEPEDFVQQIKLGKAVDEYSSDNALALQVARDCEEKTGEQPRQGTTYKYIRTRKGYEYYIPEILGRMDTHYYTAVINTALERLGFSDVKQRRLMEF